MRLRISLLLLIGLSIVTYDLNAQKEKGMKNSNNDILTQIRQYWSISGVNRYAGGFMNIEDEIFDFRDLDFLDDNNDTDDGKFRLERQGERLLIKASDVDPHFEVIELQPGMLVLDMYFIMDKELKQLARFSLKPRGN